MPNVPAPRTAVLTMDAPRVLVIDKEGKNIWKRCYFRLTFGLGRFVLVGWLVNDRIGQTSCPELRCLGCNRVVNSLLVCLVRLLLHPIQSTLLYSRVNVRV